jgi:hypothetical protein
MKYNGSKYFSRDQITEAVFSSRSRTEALGKLGLNQKASNSYRVLRYYTELYELDDSHYEGRERFKNERIREAIPLSDILAGKHPLFSTNSLKRKLVNENVFGWKCSECELTEWRGKPIPLDLDHINGVSHDHRLENLRLLCRNCHAQTPNFCGKNTKRAKFKAVETENGIALEPRVKRNHAEYVADQRVKYVDRQQHLIPLVENSGIDFSRQGWVSKVAPIIGKHHQKIRKWMETVMPDFYQTCYQETRERGKWGEGSKRERNAAYARDKKRREKDAEYDQWREADRSLAERVLVAGIDFSKPGWVRAVREITGHAPQKVRSWMSVMLPEIVVA